MRRAREWGGLPSLLLNSHVAEFILAVLRNEQIGTCQGEQQYGNHCGENMQEVVLMVEKCGFSPAEAIAAATVNGADLLGRSDDLGRIAEGFLADVIAVPEDPTQNIGALHDVCFVMKEGRVFRNDRG